MKKLSLIAILSLSGLALLSTRAADSSPTDLGQVIQSAPTDISTTLRRTGAGLFGVPRPPDGTHTGVDICAIASTSNKNDYRVMAVSAGRIAYATLNGNGTDSFGYTIVIDHDNGWYTLYGHFAQNATKALSIKIGDTVTAGQVIGYMADLANNDLSSGNVVAESVKSSDKIQVHFEIFQAPAGISSSGALAPFKTSRTLANPTSRLIALHYDSQ